MTAKSNSSPFIIILLIFVLGGFNGFSQTGSISPYSRYGIGDLFSEGFTNQSGMGGIGAAVSGSDHINFINPASYLADSVTMFEFGARGEVRQLTIKEDKSTQNSASFSHFCLAFPIKKYKIGAAFGLLPYSSVGYNIVIDQNNVPDIGTIKYKYEGLGGINKVFLGTGFKISPKFSGGINASYLFGTYENVKSVEFPGIVNAYNSRYINGITVKGFYFNYGVMFEQALKNSLLFKAGLSGSFATKVSAINNEYYYNYTISSYGGEIVKDSVYNEKANSGSIKLPNNLRLGITLNKPSIWLAGIDFSYNNWSQYESFDTKDTLKNSYIINAGGERKSKNGKFVYRGGGRYSKTYLSLKGTQLDDYAVTMGIGIQKNNPKRPPSSINLSVELGQRGTHEKDLLREQYVMFHLGFTLSDNWFNKPKYD